MDRLEGITYVFPRTADDTQSIVSYLWRLLGPLPYATVEPEILRLSPAFPAGALPVTAFAVGDLTHPCLIFEMDAPIDLEIGALILTNHAPRTAAGQLLPPIEASSAVHAPMQQLAATEAVHVLPLAEFYRLLAGHVVRVDHTGINIPEAMVARPAWEDFLAVLGRASSLYRYPTGEEWLFVLPSTDREFRGEIDLFTDGRAPLFEACYDHDLRLPLIQIDLETDLARTEVEALFPAPHGVALPGLAEHFRSVYLAHAWMDSLAVRVDLRYKRDPGTLDGEMSRWLVTVGGRRS